MKNILTGRMRKVLFIAVCIRSSLWGEICYSAETSRIWSGSDTGKEWVSSGLQQNNSIKVTGVVTSEGGEPIIGATVQVKGTSTGVITDIDGRYTITVPDGNSILSVSFIGYQSQEIKVNSRRGINVRLQENVQSLDEVMVVAYGVQKKATLTGAISSVGTEALLKSPSASVTNSLAGQLPGVSSMQASGQPGADNAKIFVRGVGSLTEGGAAPLILVDGVERSFYQMDPNEIESINVLKMLRLRLYLECAVRTESYWSLPAGEKKERLKSRLVRMSVFRCLPVYWMWQTAIQPLLYSERHNVMTELQMTSWLSRSMIWNVFVWEIPLFYILM